MLSSLSEDIAPRFISMLNLADFQGGRGEIKHSGGITKIYNLDVFYLPKRIKLNDPGQRIYKNMLNNNDRWLSIQIYGKQIICVWYYGLKNHCPKHYLEHSKLYIDRIDFGPDLIFKEGQSSIYVSNNHIVMGRKCSCHTNSFACGPKKDKFDKIFMRTEADLRNRERLVVEKYIELLFRNLRAAECSWLSYLPKDVIDMLVPYACWVIW